MGDFVVVQLTGGKETGGDWAKCFKREQNKDLETLEQIIEFNLKNVVVNHTPLCVQVFRGITGVHAVCQ